MAGSCLVLLRLEQAACRAEKIRQAVVQSSDIGVMTSPGKGIDDEELRGRWRYEQEPKVEKLRWKSEGKKKVSPGHLKQSPLL
ncbi:hypothetical protein llap_2176 [Limosa lapponica baueri]|uniref:Uncharacterized protein n=1 Tax=Limosa lapponica baueri TaxID=1758121 RepID=A0A2I0UNB4_LIMLA|nr:hypothetical protein llap_2176 [Limosa lapponica baueri]